jgi:hypothetical protein
MECAIKKNTNYVIQFDYQIISKHGIKKAGEIYTYDDVIQTKDYITFINTMFAYGAFKELLTKEDATKIKKIKKVKK